MNILLLTNLYPPQELGGYGRSMSDFCWGLKKLGHQVHVLCSDSPHLGESSAKGPSGERVDRSLRLKGSYKGGVSEITDASLLKEINRQNTKSIRNLWQTKGPFDGILVGNIDLLGSSILENICQYKVPVLHHIGFIHPPFKAQEQPKEASYQLIGASKAVCLAIEKAGLGRHTFQGVCEEIPVIYPGVRNDIFDYIRSNRQQPPPLNGDRSEIPLGNYHNPLKVCFAGLLMGSKGAHTLIEALISLKKKGIYVEGYLAGGEFQTGYKEQLKNLLSQHGLNKVRFTGQLNRMSLARCFRLHHICVFPSIHPEAFGIVGAEAMASGIVLVSSGVGGSAELFEDKESGIKFEAGNPEDLANKLSFLCHNPKAMYEIAKAGKKRAQKDLDVLTSARKLEGLLTKSHIQKE